MVPARSAPAQLDVGRHEVARRTTRNWEKALLADVSIVPRRRPSRWPPLESWKQRALHAVLFCALLYFFHTRHNWARLALTAWRHRRCIRQGGSSLPATYAHRALPYSAWTAPRLRYEVQVHVVTGMIFRSPPVGRV